MGTSTAFQLVQRGVRRVVVVEKDALGAGASGKSSALVRLHYPFLPEARLALASLRWFQEWKDRVGGSCGFTQTGFVRLVAPEHTERLRRNVARLQAIGVPTCLVDGEALRRLDPGLSVHDVEVAAYEPESGYADGYATAQAFMAAARRGGAQLLQGVRVTGLRVAGGRVQGVETTAGFLAAPAVVVTAGAWAGPLLRQAGVALPLVPSRHQVMLMERPPQVSRHLTCIAPGSLYFRPDAAGLTLVGYGPGENGVDPDAYRDAVDETVRVQGAAALVARYPAMQQARLRRGYAGCYTLTPDGKMIVDRAPGPRRPLPGGGLQRHRLQALAGGGHRPGRARHCRPGHHGGRLCLSRHALCRGLAIGRPR
ncbi:MAG: oxidoreductase [Candidatus Tectimicrobiota bacterium]|nr:MAG: oxidoreductase [Candidatus Tectomicrobia bacterium]